MKSGSERHPRVVGVTLEFDSCMSASAAIAGWACDVVHGMLRRWQGRARVEVAPQFLSPRQIPARESPGAPDNCPHMSGSCSGQRRQMFFLLLTPSGDDVQHWSLASTQHITPPPSYPYWPATVMLQTWPKKKVTASPCYCTFVAGCPGQQKSRNASLDLIRGRAFKQLVPCCS